MDRVLGVVWVWQLNVKAFVRQAIEHCLYALSVSLLIVLRVEEMLAQEANEFNHLLEVQRQAFFLVDGLEQTFRDRAALVRCQYLSLVLKHFLNFNF